MDRLGVVARDVRFLEGDRATGGNVKAAAEAREAVGLVLGHRGAGQRQRGGGVDEGAAAQAGPAAVRLVPGEGAAGHGRRGVDQVGDATALTVATALAPGLVVDEDAVADGQEAGREIAIGGGVEVPQVVQEAAPRAQAAENRRGAEGRVVAASCGLVVIQPAAADAGGASRVVRDARPGPGADESRHAGRAAVVVAALGTVLGDGAVTHGERVRAVGAAAIARNDRASEALADQDHRAGTGVAVTAEGLVVVEGAPGDGRPGSQLRVESPPLRTSDPDNVGRVGARGVIAADGLVVAEATTLMLMSASVLAMAPPKL